MKTVCLVLAAAASAQAGFPETPAPTLSPAIVCDDLASCTGCVAKRAGKDTLYCKAWGPKKCERKPNSDKWEAAAYCQGDPCEEFPECECVGEKANGARKCLGNTRNEDQCNRKEANANNPWVKTSWCSSGGMDPAATMACLQNSANAADYCGACCPSCDKVDNDNYLTKFNFDPINRRHDPVDTSKCMCLHLDLQAVNDYDYYDYYKFFYDDVYLTEHSDCARFEGGTQWIYAHGLGGDDVILEARSGPYSWSSLHGDEGNDYLLAPYIWASIYGGGGEDVCGGGHADSGFSSSCETILD